MSKSKKSTKKSIDNVQMGLVLLIVGTAIFFIAMGWSMQSASDPDIVGANIGAGVFGLLSLPFLLAGLALMFSGLTKKK